MDKMTAVENKNNYLIQIASNLAETIQRAFSDNEIGRFKFQLDVLFDTAENENDDVTRQHCNNYYALLLELQAQRGLDEDDIHELKVQYIDWLQRTADKIYRQFAENCQRISEYYDTQEFIEWLNHHDLTFFEMQYIELQFDKDCKKQYEPDWLQRIQDRLYQAETRIVINYITMRFNTMTIDEFNSRRWTDVSIGRYFKIV